MSRLLLALFFIGVGITHFLRPRFFMAIVPPPLPREAAVYLSGVAEIIGGAALLVPRWRPFARWWLIAVLIGVFPANIYQAFGPQKLRPENVPLWVFWLRLPLQFLLINWVWRVTCSSKSSSS